MAQYFDKREDEREEQQSSDASAYADESQSHPITPEQEAAAEERAEGAREAVESKARRSSGRTRGKRQGESNQPDHQVDSDGIIQFPVMANDAEAVDEEATSEVDEQTALTELEAQGFTTDEALRLIHVSDQMATSREVRESEAALRRLRFARWLVEHGMLDEYSA